MVDRSTLFQHSINLITGTSPIVYVVHGVRVRERGKEREGEREGERKTEEREEGREGG